MAIVTYLPDLTPTLPIRLLQDTQGRLWIASPLDLPVTCMASRRNIFWANSMMGARILYHLPLI